MYVYDWGNEMLYRKTNATTDISAEYPLKSLTFTGKRVYLFGGYKLEDAERLYIPTVEYYHTKKQRWFSAFNLATYDNESFRDIDVHILNIPTANANFRVPSTAYKYPLW